MKQTTAAVVGLAAAVRMQAASAMSELFLQRVLSDTEGFGVGVAADESLVAVGAWLASSDEETSQGKVDVFSCGMTDCELEVRPLVSYLHGRVLRMSSRVKASSLCTL